MKSGLRFSAQELEEAILLTLRYSAHFHFALEKSEIWQRLPSSSNLEQLFAQKNKAILPKMQPTREEFQKSLKHLLETKKIQQQGKFFFLKEADLLSRQARAKIFPEKLAAIRGFVKYIEKFSDIQAVAVTGSVAVKNAAAEDDLDFLVVCKKDRLWLTRFLLLAYSALRGKRPHLDSTKKSIHDSNAWCFNLWLEEESLSMPTTKRSLYEAYEIQQLFWCYDRANIAQRFLKDNIWTKEFLFELPVQRIFLKKNSPKQASTKKSGIIFYFFNEFFYYLQVFYRKIFHAKEVFLMKKQQAFFSADSFRKYLYQRLK